MLCDVCGEREATVHLSQILKGGVKKLHLCQACAEQSGLNVDAPISLTDVLFGMGAPPSASGGRARGCRVCGMTQADFKKISRFGCPACYEAFADELTPMLSAMHKGTQHAGKVPSAFLAAQETSAEIAALEARLSEAVKAEQYEEAARLRDQIRQEKRRIRAQKSQRRRSNDSR